MINRTTSQLHFLNDLPDPKNFGPESLVMFDQHLLQVVPQMQAWVDAFPAHYALQAGEELKQLKAFPNHIERILHLTGAFSRAQMKIVAVGGGSVGDFAGFVASILKRGVDFIHIPTTWLAAIDSSHGGKTALNVLGAKNQIGTFYSATDIYISSMILRSQPQERCQEACGELGKIALLDGREWVSRMEKSPYDPADLLQEFLPSAIESKVRIVAQDPYETKGFRFVLNLGHTLGHVLESQANLPHGTAVAQGTFFAIDWSYRRGYLSLQNHERMCALLQKRLRLKRLAGDPHYQKPALKVSAQLLARDKKSGTAESVTFVFLKDFGQPLCVSVGLQELLAEALHGGWVHHE